MEGEYQLGSLCFWPSRAPARYSEAQAQCAVSGDASPARASLRTPPWVAKISTVQVKSGTGEWVGGEVVSCGAVTDRSSAFEEENPVVPSR